MARRRSTLTPDQQQLAAWALPNALELPAPRGLPGSDRVGSGPAAAGLADLRLPQDGGGDAARFDAVSDEREPGEWSVLQEQGLGDGGVRRSFGNAPGGRWCWVQVTPLAVGSAGRWLTGALEQAVAPRRRVSEIRSGELTEIPLGHPARGRWEHTQGREGEGVTWYLAWTRPRLGLMCCCVAPRATSWTWPEVLDLAGLLERRADRAALRA